MNAIISEEDSEHAADEAEKKMHQSSEITPYSAMPFEKQMAEKDHTHVKAAAAITPYSTMPFEKQMQGIAESGVTEKDRILVKQASEITPYSSMPFEITEMLQRQGHAQSMQVTDKDRMHNMAAVIKELKKKIKGIKDKHRMHKMAAAIVR